MAGGGGEVGISRRKGGLELSEKQGQGVLEGFGVAGTATLLSGCGKQPWDVEMALEGQGRQSLFCSCQSQENLGSFPLPAQLYGSTLLTQEQPDTESLNH